VVSDIYRSEFCFNAWYGKCLIENGKPEDAWNLYLEMDTSNDTLNFLNLISNEYYKKGQY